MAEFFPLNDLLNDDQDNLITGLSIERIGVWDINFHLVKSTKTEELHADKEVNIGGIQIYYIRVKKTDVKRYLEICYSFRERQKSLFTKLKSTNIKDLVVLINNILICIKENSSKIKEIGFRRSLDNQYFYRDISLLNYYQKTFELKTHLLETSLGCPGKDNLFSDYMVIDLENETDHYFKKLLCGFLNLSYCSETKTIKYRIYSDAAWSPSFNDRIVPDNFFSKRAQFIEYLTKYFNYTEGIKWFLLNY